MERYANANYEEGNDNWLRDMCRDALATLREKDEEIARLKGEMLAISREIRALWNTGPKRDVVGWADALDTARKGPGVVADGTKGMERGR